MNESEMPFNIVKRNPEMGENILSQIYGKLFFTQGRSSHTVQREGPVIQGIEKKSFLGT